MSHWDTRGLRGSEFEERLNLTNEKYRKEGIAVIQKIPTPIKPVEISHDRRVITLAYFEQVSTVDYIGAMSGIPICFDAKETGKKSLPFSNLHPHQVTFMHDFAAQGGLAFLLVHFTVYGETYVLPLETLEYWYNGQHKRSSVPYTAFLPQLKVEDDGTVLINYLKTALVYARMKADGLSFH